MDRSIWIQIKVKHHKNKQHVVCKQLHLGRWLWDNHNDCSARFAGNHQVLNAHHRVKCKVWECNSGATWICQSVSVFKTLLLTTAQSQHWGMSLLHTRHETHQLRHKLPEAWGMATQECLLCLQQTLAKGTWWCTVTLRLLKSYISCDLLSPASHAT